MKTETCKSCMGRGGFGSSSCGITLSYAPCCSCLGEGVIETPENSQDELELNMRENKVDAEYWWEDLHSASGESL